MLFLSSASGVDENLVHLIRGSVTLGNAARTDNQHGNHSMHQAQVTATDCANSPNADGSASSACRPGGSRHGQGRDQVQDAIDYFNSSSTQLQRAEEPMQRIHDATSEVQREVERHPERFTDTATRELAELQQDVLHLLHRLQANHVVANSNGGVGGLIQTFANGVLMNIAISEAWKWISEDKESAERVGARAAEEGHRLRTSEGCAEVEDDLSQPDAVKFASRKQSAVRASKAEETPQHSQTNFDHRDIDRENAEEGNEPYEEEGYGDAIDAEAGGVAEDGAVFGAEEGISGWAILGGIMFGVIELPPGMSTSWLPFGIGISKYPYAIALVEKRMGIGDSEHSASEHSAFWFGCLMGTVTVGSVVLGFLGRKFRSQHDAQILAREPLLLLT